MKKKYHSPEIKSEKAFEQETLACLKLAGGCKTALPQNNHNQCPTMIRTKQGCYDRANS